MHLDRDRLIAGLLLTGAVGFAVLGQLYLIQRREYVWDGIIFFAIAMVCLVQLMIVATRKARKKGQTSVSKWRKTGRRVLLQPYMAVVGTAVVLNLIAARSANAQPPPTDYTLSVLLWLSSLILIYAPFVPLRRLRERARQALHNLGYAMRDERRATELGLAIGLILVGLMLRAWDLEHIPANFSGDEGTQGMWAVDVLEGRLRNPFATGWFTVPTMSFFAQALSLRLFGDSVGGLRTLSALIGTATLVFTYLLARRTLGRRVALFALAVLAVNHYHIHFSRLASNQIGDPLFMALTLWLLTEGLKRVPHEVEEEGAGSQQASPIKHQVSHSTLPGGPGEGKAGPWFLTAGLTMGLSWFGYFGSRVIVLVVAVFLGIQIGAQRGYFRRHARMLLLMALMALMAASPLLLYYTNHPENLSARFNQVNFFRWLQNELSRPDHDSAPSLVVRQVWRSVSAFNHTLDPTFWYRAQIPLLDFISGILFVLGIAVALSRWRRPAVRLILIWFGLAILIGWILTENPPSSMRMVIITPAVAVLAALGLDRLLTLGHWAIRGRRTEWNWIGSTLLALAVVLNVYHYFIVYTPSRVYGNPSAEVATVLGRYLRDYPTPSPTSSGTETQASVEPQPFVYFFGPPFMYYDFGTIPFIARDVPGVSVPPRDQDPDFQTQVSGPTLFVVLRERLDELATIRERHPNGRLQEFRSNADSRLLFVMYKVPF